MTIQTETYVYPIVEILELAPARVICESGQNQNFNNGNTSNWY